MERSLIPREIASDYSLSSAAAVEILTGGHVNKSFLVTDQERKHVFQNLHNDMIPAQTTDQAAVAKHLASKGWEAAMPQQTIHGTYTSRDAGGSYWRSYNFLAHDYQAAVVDADNAQKACSLLGQLHTSLASLVYEPVHTLPHFHDAQHYADQLEHSYRDNLLVGSAHPVADMLLFEYEQWKTSVEPLQGSQLIHGDPKFDNILFRDGNPFTFIDWDTAMIGSPMIDLGDMLRSYMNRSNGALSPDMIEAYRRRSETPDSPAKFRKKALQATGWLTIELAMRYANDCTRADSGYFYYDQNSATTKRQDAMLLKAAQGLRQFKSLKEHLNE